MPIKKRLPKARENRITPEAVAAWKICNEIMDADAFDAWEEQGGRRAEYYAAHNVLTGALGLKPWEESPLYVDDGPPPDWMGPDYCIRESWPKAQELRRELIRAAKAR